MAESKMNGMKVKTPYSAIHFLHMQLL